MSKFSNWFLDQHPENDESHAATRYRMMTQESTGRRALKEFCAAAIIGVPLLVVTILIMVFFI